MIQTVNSYFTEKEDFPSKESNKPTNIFPPVFIKFFSYSIIYRMVSHTKNNTQHVHFAKKLITRSTNSRKNIYENVKRYDTDIHQFIWSFRFLHLVQHKAVHEYTDVSPCSFPCLQNSLALSSFKNFSLVKYHHHPHPFSLFSNNTRCKKRGITT